MPAGSKPGERRGGRPKGVPNKKTIERLEAERIERQVQSELARRLKDADRAEKALEAAKARGKKLAKDVLAELMEAFYGVAAMYQPIPAGQIIPPGRTPNEDKFEKWGRLTGEIAGKLAPFQSPTFRAIQVVAPTPESVAPAPRQIEGGNVIDMTDPVELSRIYQRRMTAVGPR